MNAVQTEPSKRGRRKSAAAGTLEDQLKEHDAETEWNADNDLLDADGELHDTIIFEFAFPDTDTMRTAIQEMSDDDAVLLLKSLFLRAKAGGDAEQFAELVKRCLLV
jgi:hypothetical protein